MKAKIIKKADSLFAKQTGIHFPIYHSVTADGVVILSKRNENVRYNDSIIWVRRYMKKHGIKNVQKVTSRGPNFLRSSPKSWVAK